MRAPTHPTGMLRRRRSLGVLLAILAIGPITGCGSAAVTSASPRISSEPSAASLPATPQVTIDHDAITEELDRLPGLLDSIHPDPFHGVDRATWVTSLAAYRDALPAMTPEESVTELMRVWALLSRNGRDGHQFAFPADAHERPILPLRVYEFAEGLFITDALAPNEDLVGSRIVAVGEHAIDHVLAAIEPLVPRDGPSTVPAFRPILFLRTVVLEGLGFVAEGDEGVELTVEDAAGVHREVTLVPVAPRAHREWAGRFGMYQLPVDADLTYLEDSDPFGAELMDGGRVAYLRYRFVAHPGARDARAMIERSEPETLLLDLRQNPGGDNHTYAALLRLVQDWAAEHPNATVILTDRVTFSAAANLATEIERSTDAVFVGEAMGGAPNLYGDVTWVHLTSLPIPMRVAVSTRWWQMSEPDDDRLTIEPDVAVGVTAADHFAGRDPALEAALALGPGRN